MNPKPAANYSCFATYAQPEFRITVIDQKIKIELEHDDLEFVFDTEIKQESKEIQAFLSQQRKEAELLIHAMKRRNTTLLQIMQIICEIQQDFFLHQGSLKHLTLEMLSLIHIFPVFQRFFQLSSYYKYTFPIFSSIH